MRYKAIEKFADMTDNNFLYNVGDEFPRLGKEVSAERVAELMSNRNKVGRPVIAKIEKVTVETVEKVRAPKKTKKKA